MDNLVAHEPAPSPELSYCVKRKAEALEAEDSKRVRSHQYTADTESDGSSFSESPAVDDAFYDHRIEAPVTTPLTPISSAASPRYPQLKTIPCPYLDCDKKFNRQAKLDNHLRSHTNTRPFVCPHLPCTKDFLRVEHLRRHIKSAHSDVRDYACEWEGCEKTFATGTRLRRHLAAHEGKQQFSCRVAGCGQTFRKHGTLQKHVKVVHEGRDPFVCDQLNDNGQTCGAGFETETRLRTHIGGVHGTKRYFMCTMCSINHEGNGGGELINELETSFPTYAALQLHISEEHPPMCPECGLKCTSQNALKSHFEVLHGGLSVGDRKTHVCPEENCGKTFTKKGNLNAHVQIVHKGKRFICGEVDPMTLNNVGNWDGSNPCGEPSISKANLERHIREVHMGSKSKGKSKAKERGPPTESSALKGQASTLMRLTGVGYDTDSGREILCLVQGCNHRFLRQYDHEIHLQSRHGLADVEIQGMLMERDSYIQPAAQLSYNAAAEQGFGAPVGFESQYHDYDSMYRFETYDGIGGTSKGEDSWFDGDSLPVASDGHNLGQDEMSMQAPDHDYNAATSIGECGHEDVDMIDPTLI